MATLTLKQTDDFLMIRDRARYAVVVRRASGGYETVFPDGSHGAFDARKNYAVAWQSKRKADALWAEVTGLYSER